VTFYEICQKGIHLSKTKLFERLQYMYTIFSDGNLGFYTWSLVALTYTKHKFYAVKLLVSRSENMFRMFIFFTILLFSSCENAMVWLIVIQFTYSKEKRKKDKKEQQNLIIIWHKISGWEKGRVVHRNDDGNGGFPKSFIFWKFKLHDMHLNGT